MKLQMTIAALSLMGASAFATTSATPKTVEQIQREICTAAFADYPDAFESADDCFNTAVLETNENETEYQISFNSCATGEFVTGTYYVASGDIDFGSSGLDSGECDDFDYSEGS